MANGDDQILGLGVLPCAQNSLLAGKQLPGDQPQAGASRALELLDDG